MDGVSGGAREPFFILPFFNFSTPFLSWKQASRANNMGRTSHRKGAGGARQHRNNGIANHTPSNAANYAANHAPSHAANHAPSHAPNHAPSYAANHAPSYAPNHAPSYAPNYAPSHAPSHAPSRASNRASTRATNHAIDRISIDAINNLELRANAQRVLSIIHEARPDNTIITYSPKQKEFQAFCNRKQYHDNDTVTEDKLLLFLVEDVANRPLRGKSRRVDKDIP